MRTFGCSSLLGLAGILSFSMPLWAQDIRTMEARIASSHVALSSSQEYIDSVSEKTQQTVDDVLSTERQSDITEAYNAQLVRLTQSQDAEIKDLRRQIDSIAQTEQAMLPLLNVMVARLSRFVESDLPFLASERGARLDRLERLLDRADVSIAEKYRQILEAYIVEVGYGRTIEAYSDVLTGGEFGTHVNYLRMGRMALYYQTLNGYESALWLPRKQAWRALDPDQNQELTKALQIARQQRVPELLDLPVPSLTSQ